MASVCLAHRRARRLADRQQDNVVRALLPLTHHTTIGYISIGMFKSLCNCIAAGGVGGIGTWHGAWVEVTLREGPHRHRFEDRLCHDCHRGLTGPHQRFEMHHSLLLLLVMVFASPIFESPGAGVSQLHDSSHCYINVCA